MQDKLSRKLTKLQLKITGSEHQQYGISLATEWPMIRLSTRELIRHVILPGFLYIVLFFGGSEIIEHAYLNKLQDSTIHFLHLLRGIFSVFFVGAVVLYSLSRAERSFDNRMEGICNLLNASNEGLIAFDRNWRVVSMNTRANELLGNTDSEEFGSWAETLRQKFQNETEFEALNPAGNVTLRVVALQSHEHGCLLLLHDATQEKKREENWLMTEKMASIGRMSAGLAHEIGTPLNIILGRAELIEETQSNFCKKCEEQPNCGLQKHIQIIFQQIERISNIIQQLLTQARTPESPNKQLFSINSCVENVVNFLRPVLDKKNITLHLSLQENMPELFGFPDQFQQVLINLISNSIDAMEGKKGPVHVSTTSRDHHIELSVTDTGCGISDTNLTRIFDPFFTTKEFGKGTGLGLTVTSNIVRAHGGSIDVRTKLDQGTMISIQLPIAS